MIFCDDSNSRNKLKCWYGCYFGNLGGFYKTLFFDNFPTNFPHFPCCQLICQLWHNNWKTFISSSFSIVPPLIVFYNHPATTIITWIFYSLLLLNLFLQIRVEMCRKVFPSIVKPNNKVVTVKFLVAFSVCSDIFWWLK